MKKIYIIFLLLIPLFFYECSEKNKTNQVKPFSFSNPPLFRKDGKLTFSNNGKNLFQIDIEIVETAEERERGLMYRNGMSENKGMLFIMDSEDYQSFWMCNTIMSLDIIYISSKYEIVNIYENTKILDKTSLPSRVPALYVVEINAGLCKKYDIKIGNKVLFKKY